MLLLLSILKIVDIKFGAFFFDKLNLALLKIGVVFFNNRIK